MGTPDESNSLSTSTMRTFLVGARSTLREPLTSIVGNCEMLLEDAAREGAEDFLADLRKIEGAGRRLASLVDEMLDPAKIERYLSGGDLERSVSAMRHDLRTPLNAIIGYSEMLVEDLEAAGGSPLAAELERVHSDGHALLKLIDSLFSTASVERAAGRAASDASVHHDSESVLGGVIAAIGTRVETSPLVGDVLIVDDNEGNREVLARRLEREGCTVVAVDGGEAALELLESRSFDLVLLDVLMPGMNGLEVLAALRTNDATRDLPVVMLSALDEADSVVRCIELGADDYLSKPFNPVLLRARIGACLEKKRLRDAEAEYLRAVSRVTDAAGAIESGTFETESLGAVAARDDALGRLARVFRTMAKEVYEREQRLKSQVARLQIEIDRAKAAKQVSEITETDYFRQLRQRAKDLRKGGASDSE